MHVLIHWMAEYIKQAPADESIIKPSENMYCSCTMMHLHKALGVPDLSVGVNDLLVNSETLSAASAGCPAQRHRGTATRKKGKQRHKGRKDILGTCDQK